MRPLLRVMAHVDTEHPIEMPTSVDEDVVQAFRADGPYEPLGEGVGPWRPDRAADDLYLTGVLVDHIHGLIEGEDQ